jgi:acetyltransferase-like isoleucine patch superfamily enzyme
MRIISSLLQVLEKIQFKLKLISSRELLAHLGENTYIHPTVTLNWPEKIYISDNCKLYKGTYLNSRTDNKIGIHLGEGVKIHEYTYVDSYGGSIFLDDYAGVGHHCMLGGHGGLKIGKYTMISGLTYIVPANHIFKRKDIPYLHQGETKCGIKIGNNVWVGARCVILDGVNIGNNSVIGAGSVVTKNIPPNVLAIGSPATIKREL